MYSLVLPPYLALEKHHHIRYPLLIDALQNGSEEFFIRNACGPNENMAILILLLLLGPAPELMRYLLLLCSENQTEEAKDYSD